MGAELHGIGIGCTGPVDPVTGVLGTVDLLPGWQGGAMAAELAEGFHVPVAMENDADAAGLAEAVWGAGRGKRRFLYVTVGTGIGVAIILDGALYRGVDGSHPEVGHQSIDASGPPCYCGARGCWEILASGPALLAWARGRMGDITMKGLCELLADAGTRDVIALGGGVMESSRFFLERARQVIRQCCTLVPFEKAELTRASLGADTALAGAAQVWHHRFGSERKAHAI